MQGGQKSTACACLFNISQSISFCGALVFALVLARQLGSQQRYALASPRAHAHPLQIQSVQFVIR